MKKQTITKLPSTAWKPGQSGNANGRPLGARQKIAEAMLADLADVWKRRGAEMMERLANDEPGKLTTIAFGLLPKDIFVQVQQKPPAGLTADEHMALRGVLDAIEQAKLGDMPPAELFAGIESYLRGEFAKTIEHEPAEPRLIEHQPAIAMAIDAEPVAIALPKPPY